MASCFHERRRRGSRNKKEKVFRGRTNERTTTTKSSLLVLKRFYFVCSTKYFRFLLFWNKNEKKNNKWKENKAGGKKEKEKEKEDAASKEQKTIAKNMQKWTITKDKLKLDETGQLISKTKIKILHSNNLCYILTFRIVISLKNFFPHVSCSKVIVFFKTTFRKNFKTNIFFSKKLFFISPNVIAVIFWNILTIFEDWMERGCFGNWYSRQETNKRTFDVLVISRFCAFCVFSIFDCLSLVQKSTKQDISNSISGILF